MATDVTLREEKFDTLLHRFDGSRTIYKIPAPGLVELIEAGQGDSEQTRTLLRRLLAPYVGKLDALVLGCTHYPFVRRRIAEILGPGTEILHGGQGTARETKRRLEKAGLLRQGRGQVLMKNSDTNPKLAALARQLLNMEEEKDQLGGQSNG